MSPRPWLRNMVDADTAPPWLRNRPLLQVGYRFLAALVVMFDALIEWAIQGAQSRLPGVGTSTALRLIGLSRGIRRGFVQSDSIFAGRLGGWLPARKLKGHPMELLRQLRDYLKPYSMRLRHVDTSGNWHTIEADGTEIIQQVPGSWVWKPEQGWAEFYVILYPPAELWPVWDQLDGTCWAGNLADDSETMGQQTPYDVMTDIMDICYEWSAAHALLQYVIIAYVDTDFDPTNPATLPDETWRLPWTDDAVPTVSRNPNARYWEGKDLVL